MGKWFISAQIGRVITPLSLVSFNNASRAARLSQITEFSQ